MYSQEKDYEWFKDHVKEIYAENQKPFVVISDEKIVYRADTFKEALDYSRTHIGMGKFLIQQNEGEIHSFMCHNHVRAVAR